MVYKAVISKLNSFLVSPVFPGVTFFIFFPPLDKVYFHICCLQSTHCAIMITVFLKTGIWNVDE